jgi:predicted ArsR family transcriptional regulator
VITSTDVAESLDCSAEAARQKLAALYDRGDVDQRKTGRTRVWWRSDRRTGADVSSSGDGSASAGDSRVGAVVERVAEEWDDTDDRLADRKAAARAVLEYAREHGSVSKQEAKEEVYPEHPVEGQNPRTWYRQNIRPVLNEAAEYDSGARAYRLVDGGE